MLAATIDLPYVVLSATSPLVQLWFSRAHSHRDPYRLFALSNTAPLAALLCYPFWVETRRVLRDLAWIDASGVTIITVHFRCFGRGRVDQG